MTNIIRLKKRSMECEEITHLRMENARLQIALGRARTELTFGTGSAALNTIDAALSATGEHPDTMLPKTGSEVSK